MSSPLTRIRDVAEGQWGLVTLQQAGAARVAWRSLSRLVEGGLLERVARGVYRVRGAAEPDHLGLRAAWLQLDPARPAWERLDDPDVAVVSHASAAALYGVGDLRADAHEFTLPSRRQTRRADVRVHRGRVPPEQRVILGGLPATRAGRMIGDLLADHVDPDAVARITAEVLERVLDYPHVVAASLAPHAHRFGAPRGDGLALLDELLWRAGSREREVLLAEVRGA
ncbi:MAG: type IV toxin-antitoxin system AbiEi family antitoxin domain-containing protein [Candidatus Limnocylindrales bacterium]